MALVAALLLSAVAAATIISWICLSTFQKYNRVSKVGLPVLFTPISYSNFLWILFRARLVPLIRYLPFGLGNFVEYIRGGWQFRTRLHERFGPAFIIVSPGLIELVIADPTAAEEVLTRSKKDFTKPEENYKYVNIFGENVVTTNGEVWQRHRLVTAPPFNERNSNLVWRESLSQAREMLESWTKERREGVGSTVQDTMTLALNVLMSAGLGKPCSYGQKSSGQNHHDSFRDTLRFVLDNLSLAILTTWYKLPLKILPSKLTTVKNSVKDLILYLTEMVDEERNSTRKAESHGDNLLSALFRASESTGRHSLSDQEIVGNLFVYNLAGHDTTANTLAYALTRLAADVKTQEWIREETDTVLGKQENLEYEKIFPQLKRCLAVMYETLRLYSPVVSVPRETTSTLSLKIGNKEYTFPPNISVAVNASALHTRPEYWGSDALTWRPQRWIITNPSTASATLENETLFQPVHGAFVPWILGPRVCPGKKFSQVEFTAVLSRLFRRHSVRPVLLDGETEEEAAKRAVAVAEDSRSRITLKMRHPERISLRWEEIGG